MIGMNKIEIINYKPSWVSDYSQIATQIRDAVGASATRIDHIGSTSVEGLAAKDVIDIQVSVADLDSQNVVNALAAIGYVDIKNAKDNLMGLQSDSADLAKYFLVQPEGERRIHVHVREEGRINQRYPLLFRDFLRSNSAVRDAYQAIKIELAKRFANDSESYYAIKDPHMDTVYEAAKVWAESTDWHPDSNFR